MTREPRGGLGARLKRVFAIGGVAVVRAAVDALRLTSHTPDEGDPAPGEPFSWRRVLGELRARIKDENVPFLSAGLAYYGILAIVPGLIATVSAFVVLLGAVLDSAIAEVRQASSDPD